MQQGGCAPHFKQFLVFLLFCILQCWKTVVLPLRLQSCGGLFFGDVWFCAVFQFLCFLDPFWSRTESWIKGHSPVLKMGGNSQRQPGREPQRQPPETAPPALPDHHHPQTHQTPLHPPHQPPTPTPPITQLHQPNPATQPPLQPHQPQHPPAAETQKGNTPNNTKNAVLGYPKLQKCGWSPRCKTAQNALQMVQLHWTQQPTTPMQHRKTQIKHHKHSWTHTDRTTHILWLPNSWQNTPNMRKRAHKPQGFSLFSGI